MAGEGAGGKMRGMRELRDILLACLGIVALLYLGVLLASYTVIPMYHNYQDHGSIFLK